MFHAFLPAVVLATGTPARADKTWTCAAPALDQGTIRNMVHAFYEAERTGDSIRWRSFTTTDFTMFHEGVITPPKAFAQWIDRQHAALQRDKAAWWTIDVRDLKIEIDCTTALTTQVVHVTSEAPTLKPGVRYDETFLESFWFRRTSDAAWRIAFWNAAKTPDVTPSWAKQR